MLMTHHIITSAALSK